MSSALAMSRPFSKTYSRTAQKADHAAKAFDAVVLGTTGKPCPVKAASIIQKWGKASFTSTRGSPSAAPNAEKSRKRKIADDRNSDSDDDDPFSFNLEDVGPSKTKRGMGYKLPDKSKGGAEPAETTPERPRNVETNKKVLRDAGRRIERLANIDLPESGGDSEVENGTKRSSSPDIRAAQKDDFASEVGASGDHCDVKNGKGAPRTSQRRQLLMDDFAKKATALMGTEFISAVNSNISKPLLSSKPNANQSLKPAAKKFFVSRDRKNNNREKTSLDAFTSSGRSTKGAERLEDVWDSDSANWDVESGDPEIIFNSAKKMSNVEAVVDKQPIANKQTVIDKRPVVNKATVVNKRPAVEELAPLSRDVELNALDCSEKTASPVKEMESKNLLKARPEAKPLALHTDETQKSKEKSQDAPVVKRLLTGLKKVSHESFINFKLSVVYLLQRACVTVVYLIGGIFRGFLGSTPK